MSHLPLDKVKEFQNEYSKTFDKEKYIIYLYTQKYITYKDLKRITQLSSNILIDLFKRYDVKVCSNPNCTNIDGRCQSRLDFSVNNQSVDGLMNRCKLCNYQAPNLSKQEINIHKNKIKYLNRNSKIEYMCYLYCQLNYTYRTISTISRMSIDECINVFEDCDVKVCNNNNCVNGRIQSRSNFDSSKRRKDGLEGQCKYCYKDYKQRHKSERAAYNHKYWHNNKETIKQKVQEYNKENKEHVKERKRRYDYSFAKFDVRAEQISFADEVRKDPNNQELLQVKCSNTDCLKWFNPTNRQIMFRAAALKGTKIARGTTENRLYCSQECKNSCPLYKLQSQQFDENGDLKTQNYHNRRDPQIQSTLRQKVLERDGPYCARCKNEFLEEELVCDHIKPSAVDPIESADYDNCHMLCKECHNKKHEELGCSTEELIMIAKCNQEKVKG